MARAPVWDGRLGAKRSHSPCYGEHLQRRRPPKAGCAARDGLVQRCPDQSLPENTLMPAPAPAPQPPAAPGHRLAHPQAANDLLMYRLNRLIAVAGSLVVRLCEGGYGITRREWRILSSLVNREGVLSSELASIAMLDRARTSRNLTRLAQKNLVLRVPKPSDRREVHIYLTDEGRRLHSEVFPRIVAIQRELLIGMTGAQREQLSELLALLQAQSTALVAAAPGPALPPLD